MKKFIAICFLLTISAGCASTSTIPEPYELRAALNARYLGKPIQEVAARFGIPNEQMNFEGTKVYIWHRANTMYFNENTTSTTRGHVGDLSSAPWTQVPYAETTQSTQKVAHGLKCALQVGVDDAGRVKGIYPVGQMGACQMFMP